MLSRLTTGVMILVVCYIVITSAMSPYSGADLASQEAKTPKTRKPVALVVPNGPLAARRSDGRRSPVSVGEEVDPSGDLTHLLDGRRH